MNRWLAIVLLHAVVLASAHAAKTSSYIDLSKIANADPHSKDSPFQPGFEPATPENKWFEGETVYKKNGDIQPEPRKAASGGLVMGKDFGKTAGEWLEWNFDLSWESNEPYFVMRAARDGGAAHAVIDVTLDGQEIAGMQIAQTGGWGDDVKDFNRGIVVGTLPRLEMGRHILRLTVTEDDGLIRIDGFWLSASVLDVINVVGKNGKLHPPAHAHNLVYTSGKRRFGRNEFLLIDAEANGQKGFYLSDGKPLQIACEGRQATSCVLLGAGVRKRTQDQAADPTPVTATIDIVYRDGAVETQQVAFPLLFTDKPEPTGVYLGLNRYAYPISIPLKQQAVKEIIVRDAASTYVILAATLVTE